MHSRSTRRLAVIFAALFLPATAGALAGTRIERDLPLEPGGRLILDSDRGSVSIRGADRSGLRVTIVSEAEDLEAAYEFGFEAREGAVEITARRKGGGLSSWLGLGGSRSLSFEIEVPERTALEIATGGGGIAAEGTQGTARLQTSGGSIKAREIGGPVTAVTSGGSISLETIEGDVTARTSGGSIRLQSVAGRATAGTSGGSISARDVAGDLKVTTSGGSIEVAGAGGRVEAETSGGAISAAFIAGNARGGDLVTSGGGIRVALDSAASLKIDAVASGGTVSTDLRVSRDGENSPRTLKGTLGSGGETLRLRTRGGPIRIEAI